MAEVISQKLRQKEVYREINERAEKHEEKSQEARNILKQHGIQVVKDHQADNIHKIEVHNLEKENSKFIIEIDYATKELKATEILTDTNEEKEMKYADVKRTLNGIKETKKHWGNKVNVEQEQVFQEYSHSKNEGLADSLDFLTDNNGNNHYGELKNNTFECKSIAELKKGKHFTDYSIELEDNQKNNFQYTLRTEKKQSRN